MVAGGTGVRVHQPLGCACQTRKLKLVLYTPVLSKSDQVTALHLCLLLRYLQRDKLFSMIGNKLLRRVPPTLGIVVCLCLSIAWSKPTMAVDSEQYVHSVWQRREGLMQPTVRAFTQTRDGYLWLATWGGLVRFDGVNSLPSTSKIRKHSKAMRLMR